MSDTVEKTASEHTAVGHDSEHPLFILYTSGTAGKAVVAVAILHGGATNNGDKTVRELRNHVG